MLRFHSVPDRHCFMVENSISQRSVIFLLGSVALITLPHAAHIPVPLFAFFTLLLAWRAIGIWRDELLPGRLLVFLLTLVGIALLVSQQHGVFGRDAGTGLFTVALGLKLLEIRGGRDVFVIICLAFIVAATQFLYEQSILMAVYILLVSAVLLATLVMLVSRQSRPRAALATAAMIIFQALPLAVIIFVLFPRIEAPRWRWLEADNKALSGLTNTLEPGSINGLSLSDELVFRARFDGELPPPEQRYWRGPVYSHTDGVRWTASGHSDLPSPVMQFSGPAHRYTLLMEPQKERWIFAMEMAADFDGPVFRNSLNQLLTRKNPGERAEYKLTSYPEYTIRELGKGEYADNLQLPAKPSPQLLELVERLRGFDGKPELFIANLLRHFHDQAFFYTLTPPLMPDHPIETFLFDTRSGFCAHYATAFVYLLRVAKIPSRVVGGYQGGEFNRIGGFLEIRQADAHAWAEAWLEDQGWVRFDPTAAVAPERIQRGVNVDLQIASGAVNFAPLDVDASALSWLKRGRLLWQSVDYSWQRWVINYNNQNQARFLQNLGIEGIAAIAQWLAGGVGFVTAVLAWWVLRNRSGRVDPALRYYRRFCAKLAKAGIHVEPGEGACDFAERGKRLRPDLSAQIDSITTLFVRLCYQADAKAGDLTDLKQAVGKLKV